MAITLTISNPQVISVWARPVYHSLLKVSSIPRIPRQITMSCQLLQPWILVEVCKCVCSFHCYCAGAESILFRSHYLWNDLRYLRRAVIIFFCKILGCSFQIIIYNCIMLWPLTSTSRTGCFNRILAVPLQIITKSFLTIQSKSCNGAWSGDVGGKTIKWNFDVSYCGNGLNKIILYSFGLILSLLH